MEQNLPATELNYDWSFELHGDFGKNSWNNLVRWWQRADPTPDFVTLDMTNDNADADYRMQSMEALIRKIWTDSPLTQLAGWNFPRYSDPTTDDVDHPANEASLGYIEALYDHYNIPLIDYWGALSAAIGSGASLTDYYDAGDGIHPAEGGHDLAYSLVRAVFPSSGATAPGTLPTRLYDNGDYENEPTITNGNTGSETGTGWSDIGDEGRTSSTEGDTIAFTVTCQSFGIYRGDHTYPSIEVDIDGGGFNDISLSDNGYEIAAGRAAHTITLRVPAAGNVRIDELWTI